MKVTITFTIYIWYAVKKTSGAYSTCSLLSITGIHNLTAGYQVIIILRLHFYSCPDYNQRNKKIKKNKKVYIFFFLITKI